MDRFSIISDFALQHQPIMTNGGSETVPSHEVTIDDLVIAPQASLPPVTQLDDDTQGRGP